MRRDLNEVPLPAIPGPSAAITRPVVPAPTVPVSEYRPHVRDIERDARAGDLFEYWRIVRLRWRTLTAFALFSVIAALLFSRLQTPIYQARALIEVQDINEDFMNTRDMNPNAPRMSTPEYDVETQVRVIESRPIILAAAERLLSNWKTDAKGDASPRSGAVSAAEQIVASTDSDLRVRAQPNTRLIEILYDSTDPLLASEFINTLTTEFIDQNVEARWHGTQHTAQRLTQELDTLRANVARSEHNVQEFARANKLIVTQERNSFAEEKLKQMQDDLGRARADRIAKQSRYELALHAPPDSLSEVLDDGVLKDIQVKLNDLRREHAEFVAVYTPEHPKVKKLQAQVTALEQALERERSNIIRRIYNDYNSARRREALLADAYTVEFKRATEQGETVAHYNTLKRDLDTNRQLYDALLQRTKEAKLASAIRTSNIRVVEPAVEPERPYKPRTPLNVALGLGTGFFVGMLWIVSRERSHVRITEPGDAMFLGVPELGMVPSASAEHYWPQRLMTFGHNKPVSLIGTEHSRSAMAESFRALLMSFGFGQRDGGSPQVIVFSSASPSEGKSTVCSNIAATLAAADVRVLVIDGDLRRPQMHHIFGIQNRAGLADLLRQREPLSTLNNHVSSTNIPNLFVLTSGQSDECEANLLFSHRLSEIFRIVRRQYDVALIDTPPMLMMADARVVAQYADAAVLVIRSNTPREAVGLAVEQFQLDGTRVLGTVLNDWNPKQSLRYKRYYKSYKQYHDRRS